MKKGIIVVKNNIENYCKMYDMLSSCSISECFNCGCADYCVFDENNNLVKPFRKKNLLLKKVITTKYIVEFKEDIDITKLEQFLKNKNSDYCLIKITRNGLSKQFETVRRFKTTEEKQKVLTKQLA